MPEKAGAVVAEPAVRLEPNLDHRDLYLNRELSWLRFDERVLEEALDTEHPLLERVNFLTIFFNNLDEFFMLRVSGLLQQRKSGVLELPPDGMTPTEQLQAIHEQLPPLLARADACWTEDLQPRLAQARIRVASHSDLAPAQHPIIATLDEGRRRGRAEAYDEGEVHVVHGLVAAAPEVAILTCKGALTDEPWALATWRGLRPR